MSYISITLDERSSQRMTLNHYGISQTEEPYNTNFHKVTQNIEYFGNYKYGYSYWSAYYFHLQFRKSLGKIYFYYYYVNRDNHIVRKIEVFFANLHKEIPLIIGFHTDDKNRYFTYDELLKARQSTGFPPGGFEESDLEERLKEENRRRNKLKFNIEDKQHQAYKITEDASSYDGFIKYSHFVEDDLKYDNHLMSTGKLFENKTLTDRTILDKFLFNLREKFYDFINLYCTKTSQVLLIEFIDDSNKSYYSRKDKFGYYWIEDKNITNNYRAKLLEIQSEVDSTVSYLLDKNSNDDKYIKENIKIEQESREQQYILFTQKLIDSNSIKKVFLFYNEKEMQLFPNEKILNVNEKLQDLRIHNFTEIVTYTLTNKKEHLLIKLTKEKKNYYLHRFSKDGTSWRQLSLDALAEFYLISNEELKQMERNVGTKGLGQQIDKVLYDSTKTKLLLDEISFRINSFTILLDNINGSYGSSEIETIIGSKGSEMSIPPIYITTRIRVTNENINDCSYIKSKGYHLRKHNLSEAVKKGLEKVDEDKLYLRFYLNKHLISLYENDSATGSPRYLTYSTENDLFVYFYGEKSTRPLLLCYNGKAYKAKNKETHLTKWIHVSKIRECVCKGDAGELLKELSKARFENVIYLYDKIGNMRDYYSSTLFVSYRHQQDVPKPGDIDIYKKNEGKKLVIKPIGGYLNKICLFADVYFNRYDSTNTPLLLTLTFRQQAKKLFYELSHFDRDLPKKVKNTSSLSGYNGDNQLLQELIRENDKLEDILTYNIVTKRGDGSRNTYNSGKIQIKDDTVSVPGLDHYGFKKYKHTPEHNHKNKNGCVIYQGKPLLGGSGHTISDLQNKKYNYICVYFGSSKVEGPLLLEFNDTNTQYYYQKKQGNAFYWEKLDKSKYKELLNYVTEDNSIHSDLTSNRFSKLLQLLKTIEFVLLNTLVVLIEKDALYQKVDVVNALKEADPTYVRSTVCSPAQPLQIDVKKEDCQKLKQGFVCCCHTLSPVGPHDECQLRFLIPTEGSDYREILMYNSNHDVTPISIFYTKGKNMLYVYFYDKDPRPLSVCYGGNAYAPSSFLEYDQNWYRIKGSITFPLDSSGDYEKLFDALSKVVTFLNVVKLETRPEDIVKEPNKYCNENNLYPAHTFNNQTIQIKVTCANKTCYREYAHTPHGIDGKGDGYRLGEIKFNKSGLIYDFTKPLVKVRGVL